MNNAENVPSSEQTPLEMQPQKRTWVTPHFEEVALKDALAGSASLPEDNDIGVGSS